MKIKMKNNLFFTLDLDNIHTKTFTPMAEDKLGKIGKVKQGNKKES